MDQTEVTQPFEIPHEGNEFTRAARRKIDDDIDGLKRTIQSLRTKRNELSPISVLPSEVLFKIFILTRHRSIGFKFRFYNAYTPWIRVGHVCHHWRQVALGCPQLWSVPVFTKPDLAQEMMQRSKMAALTIRSAAGFWCPRMLEELGNAMAQMHRIESIELALEFHPQKLEAIFSSLSQPAPFLEEISLCDGSLDGSQVSFPMDALSDAPRLRSIDLCRLNFSWESAIFRHRNLTNLRLSNNFDDTPTIGQMMDVLHHLPNLRVLALTDSIPSHATSNGNTKILEFKFLEYLELHGKAVDCIFLLRHIRYPPCATVRLYSFSTATEDSTTILSLIGQNLRRIQSIEAGAPRSPIIIRSARLTSDIGYPEITFFNEVNNMKHSYIPSSVLGPIITIHLGSDRALSQACGPLLTSLYNCFDLSSLQGLFLGWSFTHNEIHVIRDAFGKLPKLNIIHMRRSLPEICLAIAENPNDSSTQGPEETQIHNPLQRKKSQHYFPPDTVFPALRSLVIKRVDFRHRHHPENVEHLIDMLMKRSDMNAPIDRLSLQRCLGLRTWQKRQLGELVVDLVVEHKIIDVKELDSDDQDDYTDEDEDESDYSDGDYFSYDSPN